MCIICIDWPNVNIPPYVFDESIYHSSPHYPHLLHTLPPPSGWERGLGTDVIWEENLKRGWEKVGNTKRGGGKKKTKEMEVKIK
jgi:hypothetical protein